jgi:hypothetical protein
MRIKARSEKANVPVPARPGRARRLERQHRRKKMKVSQVDAMLTIADLGWTEKDAARIRAQLSSFAEDWDDTKMDVYNEPAAR